MKKSKVRLLTKTLAVVSLLAPASGHPLGIGEIKLHSALNQNLNAEISLTLSGESLSDIKVSLAPPEKFDEAGVAWNYFLSKIKFETVTQSNGSTVIKLTSKEALKEPFLDFLLEVSWPKGNLYREFTVLVDPPSVYSQAAVPASTSSERYAQPAASAAMSQSHAGGQSSEGEYGPTLANDTLWSVAERVRGQQNDVSVEQMMMALYEANPQAFYKGNVYALTAGKMLKVPERESVLKLSRNQALAEFNRHKKAWKTHSVPGHVEAAKEKRPDNQLTLDAPTKTAVTDHAVVAPVSEQAGTEKKTADASSDGAIQSKVAELEKQLAMMQELIALKDQQLAALQNQSQANPVVPGAAPSEVVVDKPAEQVPQQAVVPPVQPVEPAQPVQSAPPAQPVPGEAVTAKPADQTAPVPQQAVVQPAPPVQPVKPVQPVAQPAPEAGSLFDPYYLGVGGVGTAVLAMLGWLWWRKRKVDQETNTESMFASSSMIQSPEAEENISVPVVEDGAAAVHDVGTVGESSFLSEFTPSDFDSFDTDQGEIDPISEADVYLAYGRYQQAEELIRQAIKDQPNRDECKLKLLEIFYANENKTDFEIYANELAEAGKRNEAEFWEQAAEMGREICPDSPLFSSGDDLFAVSDDAAVESMVQNDGFNQEGVSAGAASFGASDNEDSVKEAAETKDGGLDFDLTSSEVEDDSFVDRQRNNKDIDFDLSSFSLDTKVSEVAENDVIASSAQSGAQIEEIDFDLSSFSVGADEADKDVKASGTQAGAPIEEIDFDLSSFSVGSDEADKDVKASGAQPREPIEEIDFDLSSFSVGTDEADKDAKVYGSQAGASLGAQIEDFDFDLGSFSMDIKESGEADKDVATSSALSDQAGAVNKKQEFESYEFDFSPNNTETEGDGDFGFSAVEKGGKNRQDLDFSADTSLDFNEDLDGDFDFDFDLDMPSTISGQDSKQHGEFGVSDLTDMDELETKLDLAKAYVDMGDADAAKDIAREVLEQGTAEQKKIAQALLDELE
ncbi:MAG: FimV/HubP family polar landmark protein [Methylobacter sp.]